MAEFRRGQIWWVDFGTPLGSEQGGARPALIVQCDAANESPRYPMSIVCPVSSTGKSHVRFHVEIDPEISGLKHTSWIKCEQIRSVAQRRFSNRVSELPESVIREVDEALRYVLQLK